MKNLILVFLLLLIGCKKVNQDSPIMKPTPEPAKEVVYVVKIDTVRIPDDHFKKKFDSVQAIRKREIDSLKILNNKLGIELLHNKLIIQNAKYYLNIVNKNPKQDKFLKGWMRRALFQETK